MPSGINRQLELRVAPITHRREIAKIDGVEWVGSLRQIVIIGVPERNMRSQHLPIATVRTALFLVLGKKGLTILLVEGTDTPSDRAQMKYVAPKARAECF